MAAFNARTAELETEGITLIAASVDDEEDARGTVEKLELTYPVGFGLDMIEISRSLGAYYEVRRSILQATGFVVRPDRTIATVCYSSGPIGRLDPEDVLRVVRFWKKRAAT